MPAEVARACDEVQAMVQASIGAAPRREDGVFDDSMRRGRVLGCRLSADEIISATAQTKEGQSIESRMNAAGWAQDLRYSADGPGSSSIGMRRRDLLCYVSSSVDVADDDDTTSTSKATPDSAHDVIECVRDVSSNTSDEVPDTLWSIARERGLDSLYAFDFRLQTPPYLSADFDGDGVPDAAVLIGERSSGKLGVALVLRGSRQVVIIGAGKPLDGWGDDFSGIKEWDTFRRGSMRVVAKDYPSEALTADALWMSRRDSTSGFIVRSGDGYRWIAPLKR